MQTAAAKIDARVLNDNQVRVEKVFAFSASTLFKALSSGRLFFNCSGDQETFENDFRVGGSYRVQFRGYQITNVGNYLEIVPDRKIVFTWGDKGSDTHFPMTTVTIELFADGNKTRLVLEHKGFTTREQAEDHKGGWTGGLTDLGAEMETGQIRMVRPFKVSREALYRAISNPAVFFADIANVAGGKCDFRVGGRYELPTEKGTIAGRYLEIVPNERIVFTWEKSCSGPLPAGSKVELIFKDGSEGGSSLELVHSGLGTAELVEQHRAGWNYCVNRLPARVESAK